MHPYMDGRGAGPRLLQGGFATEGVCIVMDSALYRRIGGADGALDAPPVPPRLAPGVACLALPQPRPCSSSLPRPACSLCPSPCVLPPVTASVLVPLMMGCVMMACVAACVTACVCVFGTRARAGEGTLVFRTGEAKVGIRLTAQELYHCHVAHESKILVAGLLLLSLGAAWLRARALCGIACARALCGNACRRLAISHKDCSH